MVISIVLLNSVSAQEFDFSFPDDVIQNQDFKITINFDTEDIYDVKIFAHNSQDEKVSRGEYISEIFNPSSERWQDSWNYLPAFFPQTKEYSVKVVEDGAEELCVRLRKSETDTTTLKCIEISVEPSSEDINNGEDEEEDEEGSNVEDEKQGEDNDEDEPEDSNKNVEDLDSESDAQTINNPAANLAPPSPPLNSPQKIYLSAKALNKDPSPESNKVVVTKSGNFPKWVVYSFLLFCVFAAIFIGFRKNII